MRVLWSEETPSFTGAHFRFSGMKFSPKPAQRPGIPLVIGGISLLAIRRAARLGDGWQPLGLSPEELAQSMETLRAEARACGRDAARIPVSIAMSLGAAARRRHSLGTSAAEVAASARAYAALGVETLIVSANTGDAAQARAALEMVGREVLPALG